jgi:hypothetical protein
MGTKKSKSVAKATKKIIKEKVEEAKLLPTRAGLSYTANMDNIIFEATFKEESQFDELGKYVPVHLREITAHVVSSVGPLVNNPNIKKGTKIIPIGPGKVNVLEVDENSLIGSIKPHDIIAIVK